MTLGSVVERERRHLRRGELLSGVLLGAGIVTALLAASGMLLGHSRWLSLPRALPFVVWAVLAAVIAALAARTRRRLQARTGAAEVAHAIETEQGMRRGLLVGAMEMEGSGALAGVAARGALRRLPPRAPYAPALRRDSARRAMTGAGVAAAGALVLATATPAFGDGLRAVLRPIDAWRGALLERPRLEGAPSEMLRGAPLHVLVRAPGRTQVYLGVRQTGEAWRIDTLDVEARTGVARWSLESLKGDLRLVASDGRASSDSVVVRAADRPFVGAVTLHVTYPSYLRRASETMPTGELLRLPRGTVLDVAGRASVPLGAVSLVDGRGAVRQLATSGHAFSGRLVVEHSDELRWSARGTGTPVTDLPAPLEIEAVPDSAPTVAVVAPAGDTLLAADDQLALTVSASDDHGIARVEVRVTRVARAGEERGAVLPVASGVGTAWAGAAPVDLSAMRLQPGDLVRLRAEAVDASPWSQRGVSREVIVKRPTMEETRDAARALGESAVKEARAAAAAQRTLAQRTDEAARAQARESTPGGKGSEAGTGAAPRQMSFESAEKARALSREQRAMTDRVQRLREATRQLEQQLKAAGALDTSLARQLGEAQALLRQALTPDMTAQMQKLERAAQQLSGEQSRDALRDLAQMQQRMREQLERSAEMLKRAAHEGAMQTLGDQAKELAAKERALADSGARPGGRPSAARAAELAAQAERLRDEMAALEERLTRDRAEAGATATDRAQDHAAKSQSEMRRAANEMKASAADRADDAGAKGGGERARDAAREMDQAGKAMEEARSAQVREWKKELASELDQAVQEMMQLAREERSLEQKARSGAADGDKRGAQSAVEQGVAKASERLQEAGKKSSHLSPRSQKAVSDAQQKVQQATQSVSQPSGSGAQQAGALGDAADALTRAAASLARDRERANSAGSASGFREMLEQMKQMAQQQGQINSGAQSLLGMPNGASSAAGQSLARSLARQQRGVADQLEEAGDEAGGEKAAQLAREARQLADALDGGRLDAGTVQRQQQLFRRLLDAGRTLEKEEREDTGKRQATSAGGRESFTPGAASAAGKAATRFRPPSWEELRGLSVQERRAILEYFTRLNNAPAP